jgi:hypothetical protein
VKPGKAASSWPWLLLALALFVGPVLFVVFIDISNPLNDPVILMCPGVLVLMGFVLSVLSLTRWLKLKRENTERSTLNLDG